jgi:hypothetical protein
MALGSELFNLATSYDPYGAFKEGQMAPQKYELEQQKLDLQKQAMKEAQDEIKTEQKAPLANMAKSIMPQGTSLETPDGVPTSSGLLNQQIINSQQDLAASQKMMKQATMARAMGDDKAYANLVSEARRLQTTATTNMANAKKEYQTSMDDALESVYGANSQTEYDQRVKDALSRTGIVPPKNLPETWTPEIKDKILSAMSPAARTRIEKEERARRDDARKEKSAELRDQHMMALLRNGTGGGKESPAASRVLQAFTQTADALENVSNLPITTGPMFQQKQFNSLYTAPLSALNQKLSDETSQMLQTRMTGVARGLAALESGGAATGLVGLTDSIEKGVFIPAGATLAVTLDKLGEMRRIVESSGKAQLNDPKISPERKALIQQELDIVRKAIPFTQKDIDNARKANDGSVTIQGISDEELKNMSFTEFTTQKFGNKETSKSGSAPQVALDYLKSNPSQKEAFKAKYGYLPEGY